MESGILWTFILERGKIHTCDGLSSLRFLLHEIYLTSQALSSSIRGYFHNFHGRISLFRASATNLLYFDYVTRSSAIQWFHLLLCRCPEPPRMFCRWLMETSLFSIRQTSRTFMSKSSLEVRACTWVGWTQIGTFPLKNVKCLLESECVLYFWLPQVRVYFASECLGCHIPRRRLLLQSLDVLWLHRREISKVLTDVLIIAAFHFNVNAFCENLFISM